MGLFEARASIESPNTAAPLTRASIKHFHKTSEDQESVKLNPIKPLVFLGIHSRTRISRTPSPAPELCPVPGLQRGKEPRWPRCP